MASQITNSPRAIPTSDAPGICSQGRGSSGTTGAESISPLCHRSGRMVNASLRCPPNPSVPRRLGLMGRYGHGVADVHGGGGGHYIVVGCYTLGHGGMGAGLVVAERDPATGELWLAGPTQSTQSPS